MLARSSQLCNKTLRNAIRLANLGQYAAVTLTENRRMWCKRLAAR